MSAGGGKSLDYLKHACPIAAAEVAGEVLWLLIKQGGEGGAVAFSEIHHVDVITHAGAVMGGPVAAKHLKLFAAADGHLRHEREEVVWDAEGVFPDLSAGVGSHGVEVAKASDPPGVGSTGVEIGEHLFNRSFGKAIGVDRLNGCRFRNRDTFGEAVDRGATAEDKGAAGMNFHCREKGAGACDVDIPVKEWFFDRFSNRFEPCEMDDGIKGTIAGPSVGEELIEGVGIADVPLLDL